MTVLPSVGRLFQVYSRQLREPRAALGDKNVACGLDQRVALGKVLGLVLIGQGSGKQKRQ